MKKLFAIIAFISSTPFIYLGICKVVVSFQSALWQSDFKLRADFLIECISKYKLLENNFENSERICVPDAFVRSNEMLNSKTLIGRGDFIFYKAYFGNILVVGDWYPPNLIYFFENNKYEQNSRLFLDSGL